MRKLLTICDICGLEEETIEDPDFYLSANIGSRIVAAKTVDLCKKCKKNKKLLSWILDPQMLHHAFKSGTKLSGTIVLMPNKKKDPTG